MFSSTLKKAVMKAFWYSELGRRHKTCTCCSIVHPSNSWSGNLPCLFPRAAASDTPPVLLFTAKPELTTTDVTEAGRPAGRRLCRPGACYLPITSKYTTKVLVRIDRYLLVLRVFLFLYIKTRARASRKSIAESVPPTRTSTSFCCAWPGRRTIDRSSEDRR